MSNDSRRARREEERLAQSAREAAGLAPGTAAPKNPEPTPAPAAAEPPVPASAGTQDAANPDAGATAPRSASTSERSAAKEQSSKTKKQRRGLGMLGSIGVLCLGAGAITAGTLIPPGNLGADTAVEVAATSLPAGDSLATCPATMKLFTGAGTGVDPEFEPASKDAKTSVRAAIISDAAGRIPGGELLKGDAKVDKSIAPRISAEEAETSTGSSADGSSGLKGVLGPVSSFAETLTLHAQPLGGVQTLASAVRTYSANGGDLAGLAVAGCTAPAAETWLTGAITTPGSTAVLNLVNSSASVAAVRVDLRGAEGAISAPNLTELAVAPGETKSIILAGYASNETALSAKVTASGGRVNATIQQSTLRGLVPGGIDYLGAAATANTTQVIPGVGILDPALAQDLAKPAANANAVAQVVLAATSAEGATVKVKAMGPNGEVEIPGGGEVVVASNATASLSLAGLPAGYYTIIVDADSPVSASVKMVRGTKAADPIDQAWATAAQRLGSEHLLVLPTVGSARLVLNAPNGESTVNVRSMNSDGKLSAARSVELTGGKSTVLSGNDFGKGTVAVMLSATGSPSYGAAVVQEGSYGIAALPVSEAPAGREGVTVLLRD